MDNENDLKNNENGAVIAVENNGNLLFNEISNMIRLLAKSKREFIITNTCNQIESQAKTRTPVSILL